MIDRLHTLCQGGHQFRFAFSVTDEAEKVWDVYRFTKEGRPGTLAFRQMSNGQWIIGILEAGELTEQQVVSKLNEQRN